MDKERAVGAFVEGVIAYGFYLLMTTPKTDLVRAEARVYLTVANTSRRIAEFFWRVGIISEGRSKECLS